jgi:hypothetical protein
MALISGFDPLVANTDTFSDWLNKTNEIIELLRESVLTVEYNGAGAQTIGDAVLNGEFTANTIVVVDHLTGDSNLVIISNTTFANTCDEVIIENNLQVGSHRLSSFVVSTTSANTTLDEFASIDSSAFKYLISAKNNNESNSAYIVEILCAHTGSDILFTRYGELSNDITIDIIPEIVGANVQINAITGADLTNEYEFKIVKTELV